MTDPSDPANRDPAALPDHADVVTKPPLIYLAGVLLGLWLGPRFPLPFPIPWPLRGMIGGAAAILAVAIGVWGVVTFRRAGERLDPHTPTLKIMIGGPFRWSRNPLYVGLAILHAGIGTALGNAWVVLLLLPVMAVMTWGVVLREERYLERKFGDEYRRYRSAVRRWL